jgi:hypothetical protein
MKKENALRKLVKNLFADDEGVHLTWIESHATALGAPDIQYCCDSVEGWMELKAGPDIDVKASQVTWMRKHIAAGGYPLFLIQWSNMFLIVAGSRAKSLRNDPSLENIIKQASSYWSGELTEERMRIIMKQADLAFRLTPD